METTGIRDNGFKEWADKLSQMDDLSVSKELFNRAYNYGNIEPYLKNAFRLSYNYCIDCIKQNKTFTSNDLKSYLENIHHIDTKQINAIELIALIQLCGIMLKF